MACSAMRCSRSMTSRHAAAPACQTVVAPSKARCWSSRAWRSPGLRATLPTVGCSSPVMSLKIDVLPAPLRPMIPHRSPSATVKVMFLKSSVAPNETPMLESERRVTQLPGEDGLLESEMKSGKLGACPVATCALVSPRADSYSAPQRGSGNHAEPAATHSRGNRDGLHLGNRLGRRGHHTAPGVWLEFRRPVPD